MADQIDGSVPDRLSSARAITTPTTPVGRAHSLRHAASLSRPDGCDPATTLRHYAHAVPLDDEDIADALDEMLNRGLETVGVR
jgi:hypothetical protein